MWQDTDVAQVKTVSLATFVLLSNKQVSALCVYHNIISQPVQVNATLILAQTCPSSCICSVV